MFKKKIIIPALSLLMFSFVFVSCNKEKGVCYCKYASGDKLHFDLREVDGRAAQEDSCNVISNNASYYGGECELK